MKIYGKLKAKVIIDLAHQNISFVAADRTILKPTGLILIGALVQPFFLTFKFFCVSCKESTFEV